MTDRVTHVSKPADLPPGEHHCILKFDTVYVSGCGYPDSAQTAISCVAYPTREAWVAEIERLTARQTCTARDWVATVVLVPTVTTSVRVDVR